MNPYLDIDFLRKNQNRMYYFGLGFIQVVLDQYRRVHFYNKQVPATVEGIHNHRYNFQSQILKGEFVNEVYRIVPGNTHLLGNESCGKEVVMNEVSIAVGVEQVSRTRYVAGEDYHVFFNEFHSVGVTGNTITLLTRSDIITDYAQVLHPIGAEKVCPFEKKFSEAELWALIEDTIKNN